MSFKTLMAALGAVLVVAGSLTTDALAQRRDRGVDREWVLLGEREVDFRVDRDVIDIRQAEDWYRDRAFRELHFVATGNDVHMLDVRLVYFNGYAEDLRIDRLIRRGEQLPLNLRGDRSFVRRIEMVYRTRPNFRGKAVVKVYGEPARRAPPPPPLAAVSPGGRGTWVELGCQQVSLFKKDRDSVNVGRREGRFKAIRLHVRGADVEILDLTVVYGNGEPDKLEVRQFLREGERTRPLDLKGWERAIKQVDLVYRSKIDPLAIVAKGRISQAKVCVEGLD